MCESVNTRIFKVPNIYRVIGFNELYRVTAVIMILIVLDCFKIFQLKFRSPPMITLCPKYFFIVLHRRWPKLACSVALSIVGA